MKSKECAPRHIQMSEELVGLNKARRALHWVHLAQVPIAKVTCVKQ